VASHVLPAARARAISRVPGLSDVLALLPAHCPALVKLDILMAELDSSSCPITREGLGKAVMGCPELRVLSDAQRLLASDRPVWCRDSARDL